jgi:hypothetical protein
VVKWEVVVAVARVHVGAFFEQGLDTGDAPKLARPHERSLPPLTYPRIPIRAALVNVRNHIKLNQRAASICREVVMWTHLLVVHGASLTPERQGPTKGAMLAAAKRMPPN